MVGVTEHNLKEWKDQAHATKGAKRVQFWKIQHPFSGVPRLGQYNWPAIAKNRAKNLRVGYQVALHMEDPCPISVGKIVDLFIDKDRVGYWMRVHWYEPPNGKWRTGAYTLNPAQESTSYENILLTDVQGIPPVYLFHWAPTNTGSSQTPIQFPVLTKHGKLSGRVVHLAQQDYRFQNRPDVRQKLNGDSL